MTKINVAIVGFGNVGQHALKAVEESKDMNAAGIVVKEKYLQQTQKYNPDHNVVTDIDKIKENLDVAILCLPTLTISDYGPELLEKGINTVDSFDLHGDDFLEFKDKMHNASLKGNSVSIVSAGWDPGTDSIIRGIFQVIAPKGITYTDFGPGMSMGHSVVAKDVEGVQNALSITVPKGNGEHSRLLYIELEDGYNLEEVKKDIQENKYFKGSDLKVEVVDDIEELKDYGHGTCIHRKGVSSNIHNQMMDFNLRITNPAVTAQVMVSSVRATIEQSPGSYSLLEVPLINLLPGDTRKNLCDLV